MLKKICLVGLATILLAGCTTTDEKLAGQWTSTEDGKYVVEFKGDQKIDSYDGSETARGTFQITDNNLLSVDEGEESFQYRIERLDDQNLVLLFLPNGKILHFTK